MSITKFDELVNEQKSLNSRVIPLFTEYMKHFMGSFPFIERVSFTMWAPSFNDGDPCRTDIHDVAFLGNADFMEAVMKSWVITRGDSIPNLQLQEDFFEFVMENYSELKDELYGIKTDDLYSKEKEVEFNNHVISYGYDAESLFSSLLDIECFVSWFLDVFTREFGEFKRVIIDRDRIHTNNYEGRY